MPLSAIMDTLDGVDENIAALYTEKDGKFELTGISGVKTAADVQRVQGALQNERDAHAKTKEAASVWGDLKHEDVMSKLDRIEELEAAAGGNLDEAQIEELVNKRVDGTIKSRTLPLERQIATLTQERDALAESNGVLVKARDNRSIRDAVSAVLVENKVIEHARDDALLQAERLFKVAKDEVTGETTVIAEDGTTPKDWILDIQAKNSKPHWFGPTTGGGANPGGGKVNMGENPWSKDNWNLTKQSQILREKGADHADKLAKAAGHARATGAMKRNAK